MKIADGAARARTPVLVALLRLLGCDAPVLDELATSPVLGGGVRASGPGDASHVTKSRPIDTGDAGTVPDDGWRGAITNTSDQDLTMTVYAVCR